MYKEVDTDIWSFKNDVKVITTNGNVKKDKNTLGYRAVMGKGLALQAAQKFSNLPMLLSDNIMYYGKNKCFYFPQYKIITFPTKYNFWEKSDYNLIRDSMEELYKICCENDIHKVIFPHVGCSNGGLDWQIVKNKIVDILEQLNIEFIIVRK